MGRCGKIAERIFNAKSTSDGLQPAASPTFGWQRRSHSFYVRTKRPQVYQLFKPANVFFPGDCDCVENPALYFWANLDSRPYITLWRRLTY